MGKDHKCLKEAEIAVINERDKNLRSDILDLKIDIKELRSEFKKFVQACDRKYATKAELKNIKADVVWNKNKIFDLAWKVAVTSASLGILGKTYNLW